MQFIASGHGCLANEVCTIRLTILKDGGCYWATAHCYSATLLANTIQPPRGIMAFKVDLGARLWA
jgi:hypothetical protein